MKQISLITMMAFLLSIGVFAKESKDSETVYKVETNLSKVVWSGKKVTGAHTGTLMLDGGEVKLMGDQITSTEIKLDMNSITNSDLTDPKWNKMLVDHLKSDDFFSVDKFPQASFVTTNISKSEESSSGETDYTVTGNLTIKGITHEVTFPVTMEADGNRLTANGTATLDRTKWDIKFRSGKFFSGLGDKMIYDEFEIEFNLVASSSDAS